MAQLIALSNIKKTFAERLLFEDVSFEVGTGDHVGLVGVNGSGKTTLFRIIRGLEGIDSGSVSKSREARIGVMSQHVESAELSLYDYTLAEFSNLIELEKDVEKLVIELEKNTDNHDALIERHAKLQQQFFDQGGLTYKSRTRAVLLGLGFCDEELSQSISTMSGGQKNKAQLARVLLSDANFLLLDEPTNHLDIFAVAWLEDYLASYPNAYIVISHDRYFLDKVTNRIIELKNQHISTTRGNYSHHIQQKSTENEIARRHYQNTKREIRRIEGIVEQQRRFGRERNFITAESKQKQIERLKSTLVEPERDTSSVHFKFTAQECVANDVVVAKGISKSFDGNTVFSNVDMLIKNGERVFLLGPNGCGKTTLLRILARKLRQDSGTFYYGPRVFPGYYDQNVNASITGTTLIDELHDTYPLMNSGELRNAMALFLLRGDDVFTPSDKASGGELARIQLLKIMLSGANLLFFDEPTNHLDIASREALENALEDYGGTLLIVTHDRYLVNRLADRILYLSEDGLQECIGGYDDFLAMQKEQEAAKSAESDETVQPEKTNSYKAQKDLRSKINRTKGEISRTEQAIADTEAQIKSLEEEAALPAVACDYKRVTEIMNELDELREKLDTLYERWTELSDALSELEQE